MSKSTDLDKLEKIKKELSLRKQAYESIEESMEEGDDRILGPRNDLELQKMKKDIEESKK